MKRQIILSLAVLIVASALAWRIVHAPAAAPKGEEAEHQESPEKPAGDETIKVKLTEIQRKNAHLGIAEAGPGTLKKMLPLFGKIAANEETMAHIMPRFPGIVKAVKKRLGNSVEKGEALATVESNESLRTYEITAEISGTIIRKDVTVGEFVRDDKALFVVGDLSSVWVDLHVYRQDFSLLREGLPVSVRTEDGSDAIQSTIAYLSPFGAESTQTMLARVVIPNLNGLLRPGLFVTAEIEAGELSAPLVVKLGALQTIKEKNVIFVEEGETFVAHEVELGERDSANIAILSGILPGQKYVAENSFILKAEAGKSEAKDSD